MIIWVSNKLKEILSFLTKQLIHIAKYHWGSEPNTDNRDKAYHKYLYKETGAVIIISRWNKVKRLNLWKVKML